MMTLFDDAQILKAYAKDIEDTTAHKEARETATRLIKIGKLSLDEIAECIPALSFDELKELEQVIIKAYNISSEEAENYL